MRTIAEIRRENLEALLALVDGNQAELARRVGKSAKQVNQWFGKGSARNIGDDNCRELEAAFGKVRGWMDADHAGQSHAAGSPTEKFRASVELLLYTLNNLGKPTSMVSDMDMLELAYAVVDADGRELSPAVMLDLNQRLASRIREKEAGYGVERGPAEGTGGKTGGANKRGRGRVAS
jgi:hypothetical protein